MISNIKSILHEHLLRDPSEREVIYQIKSLLKKAQPYVLFSGGKDSLVVLDLVRTASRLIDKQVVALHADTTVGLPDNLRYVNQVCNHLGIELIIVHPEEDFFTLSKKKGFPRFNARWCCYVLKVNPLRDELRRRAGNKIVFDGVRAEESRQRSEIAQLSYHKQFKCLVFHPILNWKKQDVLTYLKKHRLPVNPLYSKGFKRATECWCGVFKTIDEFKLLRTHFPEFFEKLVKLEASMRTGGSYLYKRGKRIYLRDLK